MENKKRSFLDVYMMFKALSPQDIANIIKLMRDNNMLKAQKKSET